jgi:signal transduction histidine kinase
MLFWTVAWTLVAFLGALWLARRMAARLRAVVAERDRLGERDRLKTELLDVVAHDLRTPLTSIVAYAQLMVSHPENATEFPRYAGLIAEEAGRLRNLINNLLDLSKIEAGKMLYDLEQVDLETLLRHYFRLFGSLASSRRVSFEFHIDGTLPPVLADRQRLGQVLCNLLDNALKFTRPGGRVRLEARPVERESHCWASIRVQDEGPGVPPEEREAVFEKFHTIQRQPHKAGQGTGLGLPIARQIVEAHRGKIGVEPLPGGGSDFWFVLPGLRAEDA